MEDKNGARIKGRRRLPRNIADRPSREVMELIFGKRIMREIDKLLEELNGDERPAQGSYETLGVGLGGNSKDSP